MSYRAKLFAGGVAAVLVFDALAALASRRLGFPYAAASIGSGIIYLAIGCLAARGSLSSPVQHAARAAASVGLVDASAGWVVSSRIGANQPPPGAALTLAHWVATALLVVLLAAAVGALGGLAGRPRGKLNIPAA